jgi:hypothetical protein
MGNRDSGGIHGFFQIEQEGSSMDSDFSPAIHGILFLRGHRMKRLCICCLVAILLCCAAFSQEHHKHIYLCRSPLLAFDFWNTLHDIQQKGITLTPEIAQQVCSHMKAGDAPQCIRVEVDQVKPIRSGWGGALALTDGTTTIWFHGPDSACWVHPDYYVDFVNSK